MGPEEIVLRYLSLLRKFILNWGQSKLTCFMSIY